MPPIPVTPTKNRRVLHTGSKGNDVKAYQRMLTRTLRNLGIVTTNRQSGLYGNGTLHDTLRLQLHAKIKPDGVVGPATWSLVNPQMHAYERQLLKLKPPPPTPVGDKLAHELEVMYALQLDFYSQVRPGATNLPYPWKRKADCSDSYLLAYNRARGAAYNGYGNTTTIWTEFAPVAVGKVQRGDAALYGRWVSGRIVTTHVQGVVDVTNKTNPMSIGFGSAPGNRYPVHTRTDFVGYRRGAYGA